MIDFFFYIDLINIHLNNNFILFFLLYFFLLIIFFSFSIPGGPIPQIMSGFFFGFYLGFLINIFAILIGSYFFVTFAQNIFKKFLNKIYLKFSNQLHNFIENSSYEYLILFRLIQGNPLFVQNLCFSFLNISKLKFFITSFIGLSPAVILFSYFGSKFYEMYEIKNITYSDIITKDFIFFITIVIIVLVLRIIYKKKLLNNKIK